MRSSEATVTTSGRSRCAVGFRIKSGFATVVLVTGPSKGPKVIDRRIVSLSEPSLPETQQPYHAGLGVAQTDARIVARLIAIVEQSARRSIDAVITEYAGQGHEPHRAGLVVGSEIDPQTVPSPHIRAHALEGRLFREVTEDALRRMRVGCSIWVERTLYASAARALARPEEEVRRLAASVGREIPGGWRADDKTATVAAWLALHQPESTGRTAPRTTQASAPTVDQHFDGRAPAVRAIYDRILKAASAFGPIREEPKKTSIHLAHKSAFAGVATRRNALILTITSARDIRSARVIKREQVSSNRWHLKVRLETPAEVDAELKTWLKKAVELAG